MSLRMVTLCSDPLAERRLNLVAGPQEAYAFIAGGPPPEQTFEFNADSLQWVLRGLTYQAWGLGGYFTLTPIGNEAIRVEFKSASERRITRCEIPRDQFEKMVGPLSEARRPVFAEVL